MWGFTDVALLSSIGRRTRDVPSRLRLPVRRTDLGTRSVRNREPRYPHHPAGHALFDVRLSVLRVSPSRGVGPSVDDSFHDHHHDRRRPLHVAPTIQPVGGEDSAVDRHEGRPFYDEHDATKTHGRGAPGNHPISRSYGEIRTPTETPGEDRPEKARASSHRETRAHLRQRPGVRVVQTPPPPTLRTRVVDKLYVRTTKCNDSGANKNEYLETGYQRK